MLMSDQPADAPKQSEPNSSGSGGGGNSVNTNANAIIISPKKWYNDEKYQTSLDNYSFIPTSWIRI